ncbi:MAG: tRNA (guanosine(37)-N1)-methyltransferase TrmD [Aestuariivita sp.]|nr:tRNA (guanosine(37)-N1)-methyltransferase TrmD [Aestuariivita sp.]
MTLTATRRSTAHKLKKTNSHNKLTVLSSNHANTWQANIISLLPEAFPGILGLSLIGKALKDGLWQLNIYDLRNYGLGKHRNVDDKPAGGGAGMVLKADVLGAAIDDVNAKSKKSLKLIYLSPRGHPVNQKFINDLAHEEGATFICGRYEGLDQRVVDHFNLIELSIGDFVMTGGELAAQSLIDATVRFIPGVLGNYASVHEESFSNGLLEYPQFTRPAEWRGRKIPDVLISGNHKEIGKWRRVEAEKLTKNRRPDVWSTYQNEL